MSAGTEGQVRRDDGLHLLHPGMGWRYLGHPVAEVRAAPNANGPEHRPRNAPAEWDKIDWRAHEEQVRRLRQRIFKERRSRTWRRSGTCRSGVRREALRHIPGLAGKDWRDVPWV